MTARSRSRSRTAAYGALAGGGLLMLIMAGLPWYRVDEQVSFTGTEVSGGLAPIIGVVALAGVLLMFTLRRTGQKVTAALVGAMALATGIALQFDQPSSAEVFAELRKHTLTDSYALAMTGAGPGYGLAAVVVAAGAVLTVLWAHRWPSRAGRFERGPAGADPTADREQDPDAIWKAIDAGTDPTLAPDDPPRP